MATKFGEPSSPYDLVDRTHFPLPQQIYNDFKDSYSSHAFDLDVQLVDAFKRQYPNHILTCVPAVNCNLLYYAAAGYASAKLDTETETVHRVRGYIRGPRRGVKGDLADGIRFGKYNYTWLSEEFIVYMVILPFTAMLYVLKEPSEGESLTGRSSVTDSLIRAIGEWQEPKENDHVLYVFDGYWSASRDLWNEVQKTNWDDVILDKATKDSLTDITKKFFENPDMYKDLGVPWKRGILFHGPAGNGKTISIKALMHTLNERKKPIPSLYVKSAPYTYSIRSVFLMARAMAPCLLIFEDIDTIVTPGVRSYFFNEVDGLEQNDGIMMVATTNHLDQLDPGLSKRPSRFDRKYLFPLPSKEERILYCNYWRNKLKNKDSIEFPKKLSPAMAGITDEFSFAYLKEAFVSTLLVIANGRAGSSLLLDGGDGDDDDDDDLDDYELWREFKRQVKILRDDMDNSAEQEETNPGVSTGRAGPDYLPPGQFGAVDPLTGAANPLNSLEALKRDLGGAAGGACLMPQPYHKQNVGDLNMLYPDSIFVNSRE